MPQSSIDVIFQIIARNPPSIAIAGGIIIILAGGFINNSEMMSMGMSVILVGVLLQAGWLLMQYYSKKS